MNATTTNAAAAAPAETARFDFFWRRENRNFNPDINVNRNNVNVQNWQHNSYHRRGVDYNSQEVTVLT